MSLKNWHILPTESVIISDSISAQFETGLFHLLLRPTQLLSEIKSTFLLFCNGFCAFQAQSSEFGDNWIREGVKKTGFIWDFVLNYGYVGPKVGPKSQTF